MEMRLIAAFRSRPTLAPGNQSKNTECSVLEPYLYEDQAWLLAAHDSKVIGPAEKKAKKQTGR